MKYVKFFLLVAVALFAVNSAAYAEPEEPKETIILEKHASKYIDMGRKISRIFVGSKGIILVHQPNASPNGFVITAKEKIASTRLFLWTEDGVRHEYLVVVGYEESGQAKAIKRTLENELPDSNIQVKKIGNKIVLRGTVKTNEDLAYAYEIAKAFSTASKEDSELKKLKPGESEVVDTEGEVIIQLKVEESEQAKAIKQALENELPGSDIQVKKIGNKIVLKGTVKTNEDLAYAYEIAKAFSTASKEDSELKKLKPGEIEVVDTEGEVIIQLKVEEPPPPPPLPAQIRLEAQIISIRPTDTKYLGFQYNGTTTRGDSATVGNSGTFYGGESYKNGTSLRNNPWKWFIGNRGEINFSLNALVTKNRAKLLSRPSIMTMSGETAKIKIGGEIPYRVLDNNGNASTQFKDYGIILQFKPIVDEHGRIIADIETEVSSMSGETVDGNPILDTRSASTHVILEDGATMIIGGLMDSSERKSVSKIPLLGNIPILGEFFKYSSKSKDDQELVILVTPYIINDGDNKYAKMTDEMRDYYHNGQRTQNSMDNVDLNALPPPFTEEDKKTAKRKSKKDKTSKNDNDKKTKIVIEDYPPQNTAKNDGAGVEVFGDDF